MQHVWRSKDQVEDKANKPKNCTVPALQCFPDILLGLFFVPATNLITQKQAQWEGSGVTSDLSLFFTMPFSSESHLCMPQRLESEDAVHFGRKRIMACLYNVRSDTVLWQPSLDPCANVLLLLQKNNNQNSLAFKYINTLKTEPAFDRPLYE